MRLKQPRHIFFLIFLGLSLQGCNQSGGGASATESLVPETNICTQDFFSSSYFEDIADFEYQNSQSTSESYVIRERYVTVNIESLRADILAGWSTLRLDLFDDRSVNVQVESIQKNTDSSLVVTGYIQNEPLSSVALALHQDVLMATIKPFGEQHYEIVYKEGGTHMIREAINRDDEESCMTENSVETAENYEPDPNFYNEISSNTNEITPAATTPVIDMLVTYTPAARTAAGGTNAIKALILTGIANTNKAFADSGVKLSVRLVGTLALRQNESTNYSRDLGALKSKTDGKWDEVHAERARLGADQVTVIGNYPGTSVAGIGYVQSSVTTAFTIVKRSAFPNYTFSHELGHNIGLHHEDGYVNSAGKFRTIMAYGSYPRIIRFSNPLLRYQSYVAGTSSHNSASILNVYGKKTAALVATQVGSSGSNISVVNKPATTCN